MSLHNGSYNKIVCEMFDLSVVCESASMEEYCK